MPRVLDNLSHTIQPDADVRAARAGQRVASKGERGVGIAGGINGGRVEVAQLVEPLPGNLQPERPHQRAESPIHVVDGVRLDELPRLQDQLDARPGVAGPGAEQQLVFLALSEDGLERADRLGPKRHDMLLAGFPARVVDQADVQIDDGLGQLRQLGRAVPAVERQQDHRLQLHPRVAVEAAAGPGDSFVAGDQDGADLRWCVEPPFHLRLLARGELRDQIASETQRPAPVHVGGVARGGAEVAEDPLGHFLPVPRVQLGVELLHHVGAHFVGEHVADRGVDALRAALVLHEAAAAEFAPLGFGASIEQPLAEDHMHGGAAVAGLVNDDDGRLAVGPGGGLSVVDGQRLAAAFLPAADPAGFAGAPAVVAVLCGREREFHYARPQNLMSDDRISGRFVDHSDVFPAPGASVCAHAQDDADRLGFSGDNALPPAPLPDQTRTLEILGKSPGSLPDHYAPLGILANGRPRRAPGRPPLSREFYKVDPSTGCWVWQRSKNRRGYGLAWSGERMVAAHVMMYELRHGPVPAGKQLDHLCRRRDCCNPDHLEPVTSRENSLRGNGTKLSPTQVAEIESSHQPARVLAARFGVSARQVNRIRGGTRSGSARLILNAHNLSASPAGGARGGKQRDAGTVRSKS